MKIKRKLVLSFSILTLLSIVLGLISYKTIKDLTAKVNPIIEINNLVKVHMLQLRGSEKDFLGKSLTDESYYTTGTSKYLSDFGSTCMILDREIDDLGDFSDNNDYREKIGEMHKLIANYDKQFMAVVEKKTERGFKDWGLVGELRASVRKLEEKLQNSSAINKNELLITILMSRRHEKDYLLRNDVKYQQLLSDRVNEFVLQINESDLNNVDISEITYLIRNYKNKFDQVVAIDDEIGRNASEGLMGKYQETILQLEPLIQAQDQKLRTEITSLVERTTLILLGLVISIGLISLALALILSAKITKPLISMTIAGNKISSGDLSATIPEIKSNDEVKEIGDTMNLLISALKFHKNKSEKDQSQ